jgi:hypothetical protein
MTDKPARVEYVFGGRCAGAAKEVDPVVDAILQQIGAREVYAVQGKLTVTIENDLTGEDDGASGA